MMGEKKPNQQKKRFTYHVIHENAMGNENGGIRLPDWKFNNWAV